MDEQNYTSLELSKKLAEGGCRLESAYRHQETEWEGGYDGRAVVVRNWPKYDILNDICVKHSKKFFGENYLGSIDNYKKESECVFSWSFHSEQVFSLRQQNKKQEAEDYIWEHCLFNPKNRK